MQKAAFLMRLKPGHATEYERRHDEIWPELAEGHSAAELPQLPIMRRWWDYMADLMETNPDHSPVAQPLRQVFYLA